MQLHEKIFFIRKQNTMSQADFATELCVSRQAVSKWEQGVSIPDIQTLVKIADLYNVSLDQLVRDEFELPMPCNKSKNDTKENVDSNAFQLQEYLGKICDVSMTSLRHSVIRNVKIVGKYKNLVCFIKNKKYGYFNIDKTLGIAVKKEEKYHEVSEISLGKCSVYVNKGTFFGGSTYLFSKLERVDDTRIIIQTGDFHTTISLHDVSVLLMSDKIDKRT